MNVKLLTIILRLYSIVKLQELRNVMHHKIAKFYKKLRILHTKYGTLTHRKIAKYYESYRRLHLRKIAYCEITEYLRS
jgi:hypothetical protein